MFVNTGYLLVLFCTLLAVGADTLPVFTVQRKQATGADTLMLANSLFGPDAYNLTLSDERWIVISCDGHKRVEYDSVSGGIWATDNSNAWSTALGPPKDIPTESEAVELAKALLARLKMLPTGESSVVIKEARTSGTFIAHEYEVGTGNYVREDYALDMAVSFDMALLAGSGSGPRYEVPLTGGGGKFQVTYGSCKRLIAFQALWREVVGEKTHEVMSQEESDAQFEASVSHLGGVVNYTSKLSYYSSPFGAMQKNMPPVSVYSGKVIINGDEVPIRGKVFRKMGQTPDSTPSAGQMTTTTAATKRAEPTPRPLHEREAQLARRSLQNDRDDHGFEAAVEWLGEPYGLSLGGKNAAGFAYGVMESAPVGNLTYAKCDKDVYVSDFSDQDDGYSYRSPVDMLFYIGHANKNGWLAHEPGTGAKRVVDYTSFGKAKTSGLHQDLEWLVIAACGPHQDEVFEVGAGNVFDRWRGIFDGGLRIMFGYASESVDSAEEGAKFMSYAQEGYTLIDAWFRAAKDVQPAGVIVSAMWANNSRSDHLPGYGHISSSNYSWPEERWIMWTKL